MYIKILNLHISTSLIAIGLTVLAFLITVFFIVIFKVEDKTISVINFYENEVKINVKGSEYTVKPFDTAVFTINTSNSFEVKVMNLDGTSIDNITIGRINRGPQLVSIALNDTDGYCFFSSKLKNNNDSTISLDGKVVVADTPTYSAVTDLNPAFEDYVYPGKQLDVESNTFAKVINYVYPISCSQVHNDISVLNTITAFSDYSAEDQLKYLQNARDKINESQTIESLDDSYGEQVNKYYIAEDKYLFIYE